MTTLDTLPTGGAGRIRKLNGASDSCNRLREMGFAENAVVRCLREGRPLLCQVQHSRVGISQELAHQVLIEVL